ncbi:MAG: hypothetical protein HY526_01180 [Betaproteobacteria bacterium]|nr:hypothetical protein [Betaproteobacteria bacterium]
MLTAAFARRAARFLVALMVLSVATGAFGGAFYEKDGAAILGYDPVAYFKENRPVRGSAQFTASHRGSVFRFSTAANRDAFTADPERYAPRYGGFCAYAVAQGYKAKIEPDAFTIVDGRLYLNYDQRVQAQWRKDIPGYIRLGDRNWPEVSRKPNP